MIRPTVTWQLTRVHGQPGWSSRHPRWLSLVCLLYTLLYTRSRTHWASTCRSDRPDSRTTTSPAPQSHKLASEIAVQLTRQGDFRAGPAFAARRGIEAAGCVCGCGSGGRVALGEDEGEVRIGDMTCSEGNVEGGGSATVSANRGFPRSSGHGGGGGQIMLWVRSLLRG